VSATLQNHATDIDNSVFFDLAEFCLEASKRINALNALKHRVFSPIIRLQEILGFLLIWNLMMKTSEIML